MLFQLWHDSKSFQYLSDVTKDSLCLPIVAQAHHQPHIEEVGEALDNEEVRGSIEELELDVAEHEHEESMARHHGMQHQGVDSLDLVVHHLELVQPMAEEAAQLGSV